MLPAAVRVGCGGSLSAEPTTGIYFVYDRATSTNWSAKSANNGTRSTVSGGSSVAVATGWVFLEIAVSSDALTVEFFVNGVSIGTVTTNLPTLGNNFFPGMHQLIKTAGTTPATVVYDAVGWRYDFPAARNT